MQAQSTAAAPNTSKRSHSPRSASEATVFLSKFYGQKTTLRIDKGLGVSLGEQVDHGDGTAMQKHRGPSVLAVMSVKETGKAEALFSPSVESTTAPQRQGAIELNKETLSAVLLLHSGSLSVASTLRQENARS
ncbi:MAG: hypothetical protein L6R40_007664 [Gallowayella cf. fulva]|nr:MAG: hypothetical protein L6R40_007664 [Xanthomendoza cf. fulva]